MLYTFGQIPEFFSWLLFISVFFSVLSFLWGKEFARSSLSHSGGLPSRTEILCRHKQEMRTLAQVLSLMSKLHPRPIQSNPHL